MNGTTRFLCDLHTDVSDEEMRKRWKAGEYQTNGVNPKDEWVKAWRRLKT